MIKLIAPYFLIFLPFISFSQNFSVGLYGGINAAFQQYEHKTIPSSKGAYEAKPGHVYGLSALYDLNDRLAIRSDINFERKGGTQPALFTDPTGNSHSEGTLITNIDYLQIPLIVEASFLKDRILFFNVGYNFGFLKNANLRTRNFDNTVSIADEYEKVDYSFLVGIGTKIPFKKRIRFTFEGRWQSSLNNTIISTLATAKNHSIFSAVGLRYQLN